MNDPNAIESKVAIALPGTVNPADLPDELQWMPPGRHTIQASRAGKPVKLDVLVNETVAQRIAADFQKYVDAAQRTAGDLPYCDFNHDDQEASAWPQRFYWAGEDPRSGGIRAKVDWSESGKRAVIGKTYRRFSPCFHVGGNGEIIGMPVNCGGLVNRAAFQNIQPILSKSAEFEILSSQSEDFFSKAKTIAKSRNLKLADACTVLAHEQPWSYDEYVAKLTGRPVRAGRPTSSDVTRIPRQDEFMIRARGLADAIDVEMAVACERLAHEQPALYERYRARMFGYDLDESTVEAAHSRAENSPFFVRAKAIAAERKINVVDAFAVVARENPDLYDAYRASL